MDLGRSALTFCAEDSQPANNVGSRRTRDNRTRVKMRRFVNQEEESWLEFYEWSDEGVVAAHRLGLGSGEKVEFER